MYQWKQQQLDRIQKNYKRNSLRPKQFELRVNYRSHNGIVRLASSMIDLIHRFFPGTIDRLPPEHGEVGGPPPLILDVHYKDLFTIKKDMKQEDSLIELGASQAVIVRDDKTKQRLKELYSKAGLTLRVLTVFDAKGMEFDDVLLYNFFIDSPAQV
jgi:hypothetical protein